MSDETQRLVMEIRQVFPSHWQPFAQEVHKEWRTRMTHIKYDDFPNYFACVMLGYLKYGVHSLDDEIDLELLFEFFVYRHQDNNSSASMTLGNTGGIMDRFNGKQITAALHFLGLMNERCNFNEDLVKDLTTIWQSHLGAIPSSPRKGQSRDRR